MDRDDADGSEESASGGGGFQIEILKSYLSFFRRAIRRHWVLAAGITVAGVVLTSLVFTYYPRKFNCTTVMMAEQSQVLDGYAAGYAFQGASSLIMRHENLQELVRTIGLVEKAAARRPPLLALKDRLIESAFGPMNEDTKIAIQVGTLEGRLSAGVDQGGNLRVSADWTDGKTAQEIAQAAKEGFKKTRWNTENSAFLDSRATLEAHAQKLAEEITTRLAQINAEREAEREKLVAARKNAPAGTPSATPAATPASRGAIPRMRRFVDEQLPTKKENLATLKQKVAALEADREQRMREERRKLDELKLKLTPSHPEVAQQQQRLSIASQESAELVGKRAEMKALESDIRQRESMAKDPVASLRERPGGASPLPTEVMNEAMDALRDEDANPVLTAQLSSAIFSYNGIQDKLRGLALDLERAQTAFNHRYKDVIPAGVPNAPYAPKPLVLIGAGLAITLLLAMLLPIVLELRTGIIVERWQVQLVELPVLAELHLPPHSTD